MPTLNTYACHLNTYLSYPSVLLHQPTHAATSSHPPLLFYHFSPHRLYIRCCRPVCMCDIFNVILQYACVIKYIASSVLLVKKVVIRTWYVITEMSP